MTPVMSDHIDTENEARILHEFDKLRSIPAVIERLHDVSASEIKSVLEDQKHLSLPRFPKRSGFTTDDIFDALRAADADGAKSVDRYQEFRRSAGEDSMPSAQTIILRFGSWSGARRAAGLVARTRASKSTLKSYDDNAVYEAVTSFTEWAGNEKIKPTQRAYDRWSREQRDDGVNVPLLPTIRARTVEHTWADVIRHPENIVRVDD